MDFKLVDSSAPDNILAVFIKSSGWTCPESGSLRFYTELDQDLELMAMAAILGIEERIRRNNNAGAAAGGAGGGGGA
ncbi:hypothetical protein AC579_6442, partial [Pseudocercospora musae]